MSMDQMTRRTDPTPPPDSPAVRTVARRGPIRRLARAFGVILILAIALLFAGFLRFANTVSTLSAPPLPKADAIVVLTGGYQRIDQAVELLREGAGKRLLISGVHPTTTASQIRKMTQSSANLFSCCVDMGYDALDTTGNANETARWIHDHGYSSVLVVTNNYHMPRSLHELRRSSPNTEFVAYPVVNSDLKRKNWFTDPNVVRTMFSEYIKVVVAEARDRTGMGAGSGLRTDDAAVKAGVKPTL